MIASHIMLYNITQYYIIKLYCIVLYCIVLYCILYCIILYYITLLYHIILYQAEPAPAPCSRVLSLHEVEYPEYPVGLPPGVVAVRRFFALMNARQTVSRNRARGLGGPLAYEGVAEEFAPYLRRRVCPNVRRREDRTTRALHRFCASAARERLCASEAERSWLRKLIVFNFGLWRFIGGTISFAFEVGFVSAWGESEKQRVRDVVERAQREGRIGEVLSEAYESPYLAVLYYINIYLFLKLNNIHLT